MLLTPEEAREKRCCASLSAGNLGKNCLATECMGWRWEAKPDEGEAYEYGFCGRAGKPEDE